MPALKGELTMALDVHEAALLFQNLPREVEQKAKITLTVRYDLTGLPPDKQRFYAQWFENARKTLPEVRKV